MRSITEEQVLSALKDKSEFKRLIRGVEAFVATIKMFPQHEDALIQILKDDKDEFKRLTDNYYSIAFQFLAATISSSNSEKLFQIILQDENLFEKMITSGMIVREMTEMFPHHRASIIEKTKVLESPNAFKRFIGSSMASAEFHFPSMLAACLPDQAETLIKMVLKDPALFDTYITDHLIVLSYYPSASPAIQAATSVAELRTAVKAEMLEKNKEAASAKLSALNRGGFFQGAEPSNQGKNPIERRTSALPPELRKDIADEHFGPKKK